jgi:hypothetical protein
VTRHLVVVGAQRCGTTYLADALGAQPGVVLATPRRPEPKVFLDDEVVARGVEWYVETWFPHRGSARLLVEKSTSYLDHPASGERIERVLGRPLVLAQLRDPVARAISHWRFSSEHGVEDRPLESALIDSLTEERSWDRSRYSASPFAYLSRGRYAEALIPWMDRFGDRFRVLFLDEVVSGKAVEDLFASLDLGKARVETEPTNVSPGPAPTLEAGLVARLREYFAPSDQALIELLGRPLPWGGDRQEEAHG